MLSLICWPRVILLSCGRCIILNCTNYINFIAWLFMMHLCFCRSYCSLHFTHLCLEPCNAQASLFAFLCVSRLLKQHHWIGPKNLSYNCKCEATRKKGLLVIMFMIKESRVWISPFSFTCLSRSQFLSIQIILSQLKCEKKQVEKMIL